jgi:hypothetical protein
MAGGSTIDRSGLNFKIAGLRPNGGSLPIEGGVKAAFRQIERRHPAQKEAEIEAEIRRSALRS